LIISNMAAASARADGLAHIISDIEVVGVTLIEWDRQDAERPPHLLG
jgi:hypothetical protein